jgi:hypothetical protein
MRSVRVFAQEINEKCDLTGDPPKEQAVKAGQLNAMALIAGSHQPDAGRTYCFNSILSAATIETLMSTSNKTAIHLQSKTSSFR